MNLSISNIAWCKEEDRQIYELMRTYGFTGLDVAPGRVCENPLKISNKEVEEYKDSMKDMGFQLVGMQSLLYGTEGLTIFDSVERRKMTKDHLKRIIDFAQKIGINILVFGSPKNRLIGSMSSNVVKEVANQFFYEIGEYAYAKGIYFCIEPNPIAYGADFLTNTYDAIEFVKEVNSQGFKLHIDLGTMIVNNENIADNILAAKDIIKHVHVSHPFLDIVNGLEAKHDELYTALKNIDYQGYVAIEMRSGIASSNIENVEKALQFVSIKYGGD